MNDKSHAATPRELPECFHTSAGETIEITETDFGQYCVDCWDANGEGRWNRKFDKLSDAFAEFERWRYLEETLASTPSEPKLEPSARVPSTVTQGVRLSLHADSYIDSLHADSHPETVGDRLKRLYPEHHARILSEANRVNGADHTAMMLQYPANNYLCVLSVMFIWERSAEGEGFWKALAQREEGK